MFPRTHSGIRNQTFDNKARFQRRTRQTAMLLLVVLGNAAIVFLLYSSAPGISPPVNNPKVAAPVEKETPKGALSQLPSAHQREFNGGHGLQGFVYFSGYRIQMNEFAALGLAALVLHDLKQADACRWVMPNGTSIQGSIQMHYPGEHHARMYETIILKCLLARPALGLMGGSLMMTIDGEEVPVYSEEPGTDPHEVLAGAPYKRFLTYCSPPMYGSIDPQRVKEWLEYHRSTHGVDHVHMYDAGGLDADVMKVLQPYLDAGTMDITDIKASLKYDTWLYSQVLVVNDCALRTRATSRWALMMDIDEYLHVTAAPHTLPSFLKPMPNISWVSIGSLSYTIDTCGAPVEGGPHSWAVERLVFHEPSVHCRDPSKYPSRELCLKWDGHRKYVVNPRRIEVLQIHRVMEPAEGGMNSHTSLIRLNHFRGLGIKDKPICRQSLSFSNPAPKGFVRDPSVARMALAVRRKMR
eukprot:jgi/Mesen1/9995/ME000072S09405